MIYKKSTVKSSMYDLWDKLKLCRKPLLLCGMGNGADKILAVCKSKNIKISGVFASESFVRGQIYRNMPVYTYSEACLKFGNFAVVVSFGSSLPEVISYITQLASEKELYIPSVPVSGELLFDGDFYSLHKQELEHSRSLFCDERSKRLFDDMISFYLTGELSYLNRDISTPDEAYDEILNPQKYKTVCDLGAYTGDSALDFYSRFPSVEKIISLEPDAENFRKLQKTAASLPDGICEIYNNAAWSHSCLLAFNSDGSRNSSLGFKNQMSTDLNSSSDSESVNGGNFQHSNFQHDNFQHDNTSNATPVRTSRSDCVSCRSLDGICGMRAVDFIKYDVEGAEHEALIGSAKTVSRSYPDLFVSAYHRADDLIVLPRLIKAMSADYRIYLRRFKYIPAWDLNILAVKE